MYTRHESQSLEPSLFADEWKRTFNSPHQPTATELVELGVVTSLPLSQLAVYSYTNGLTTIVYCFDSGFRWLGGGSRPALPQDIPDDQHLLADPIRL